jgi:hypothetical protein
MSRDIGDILCRDFSRFLASDDVGDWPFRLLCGFKHARVNYASEQVFRAFLAKPADQRGGAEVSRVAASGAVVDQTVKCRLCREPRHPQGHNPFGICSGFFLGKTA